MGGLLGIASDGVDSIDDEVKGFCEEEGNTVGGVAAGRENLNISEADNRDFACKGEGKADSCNDIEVEDVEAVVFADSLTVEGVDFSVDTGSAGVAFFTGVDRIFC